MMRRWIGYLLGLLLLALPPIEGLSQELGPVAIPELTVLGQHHKYNEENSAVQLIEKTAQMERAARDSLIAQPEAHYSYKQAERVTLSLAHVDKWQKVLQRIVPFFDRYLSTSKIDGSAVLPLSERQKVYLKGYNASAQRLNEAILYSQHIGMDQNLTDGSSSVRIEELLGDIDLFEDRIKVLDTEFPAPLSKRARQYYRYYLTDTIITKGYVARVVDFVPRQPHAPTFRGQLTIVEENGPRLLRAFLIFPKEVNINFIDDLRVLQKYGLEGDQWRLQHEQLSANVRFYINFLALYLEQAKEYFNYNFNDPDTAIIFAKKNFNDWQDKGLVNPSTAALHLTTQEELLLTTDSGMKLFLEQFRQHSWQRTLIELVDMVGLNYFRTKWDYNKVYGGSKVDIGPLSDLIDINPTEGLRLGVGFRTTGFLSRQHFLSGKVAYGFRDKKPKYGLSYTFSFNPKRYFREEYPCHEVSLQYQHDLYTPGLEFENTDRLNIIYDIGISYLTTASYRDTWSFQYLHDLNASLSIRLYANYYKDRASSALEYVRVNKDLTLEKLPEIVDVVTGAELRWAIGERIFEGSMQRHRYHSDIYRDVPVLKLRHEWADKRLGGDFNRHRTELVAEQRLWLGRFGRLDYQVTLGKLWSAVPFPVLYVPPTSRGFRHTRYSFQLLNPLEYVADEWLTTFVEYHMRGVGFDRIPMLNKLKLRGVVSANLLYGNLSPKNRQETGQELFVLPTSATEMTDQVYAEVGFGLENIFKILRVDVYRRLSPLTPYSSHPWGVKLDLSLNF